jgi:hypothetical protein
MAAKLTRLGTCGRYPNYTGTFRGAAPSRCRDPHAALSLDLDRVTIETIDESLSHLGRARDYRGNFLAHDTQVQAPSVYSDRPPTNGTSDGKVEKTAGIIRGYIEDGAKPVGATAGTRFSGE